MEYRFVPMNEGYAYDIAYSWKYSGIYSFYDMTADEEDLEDFLNKENWDEHYFAALNENNELIGFYSVDFEEDIMWLGLGLKPELTGRGLGYKFVTSGIKFAVEKFSYRRDYVMLAVASFNKRAIRSYEKMGFEPLEKYLQRTNGGEFEFVRMRLYIDNIV